VTCVFVSFVPFLRSLFHPASIVFAELLVQQVLNGFCLTHVISHAYDAHYYWSVVGALLAKSVTECAVNTVPNLIGKIVHLRSGVSQYCFLYLLGTVALYISPYSTTVQIDIGLW
jgi:hypothetical protein